MRATGCGPAVSDVTITRAKHSFFAVKVAYDLAPIGGGTLENSKGSTGAKGTYGKPAKCFGYQCQ